jgi:glycosyltransferase involved in cell wall biosynthesis
MERDPTVPTVSVILPTFDRVKYLRLAIGSVFAQTFGDWELIIADDGSADDTSAYLRSIRDPRVRTICLRHSGNPSRVRNAAIEVAKGRYLAFLDSDDVWAPPKLQKQIEALRDRPDRRWSYTACAHIDENGEPFGPPPGGKHASMNAVRDGWIFDPLLKLEASIAMPSVIAERGLVSEIGGFDEQQRFGEDLDLCVRLAMRSQVVALSEALTSVRHHGEHHSGDRIGAYVAWVRFYGKMAALAPDARLRSHCGRSRAATSVVLAGLQGDKGDHRSVWATLASASTFSWRYPEWWFGAMKAVVRPLVPKRLLSEYRRRRA